MDLAVTSLQHLLRIYVLEARYEFLRLLRTPSFILPTLLFPPVFYVLFGILLAVSRGGEAMAAHMLASYGVFGIMGAGLFGFGVTVAIERERGFLRFKRALPMPAGAMLVAKLVMSMLFASVISLILASIAVTFGGVSLAAGQWVLLFVVNVFGVLPFAAIGLLIGSLVGGQAAPAIVNILYLPMSFLSGLWIPLSVLPAFIGTLAPVWPAYHLGQIALKVVGRDAGGSLVLHIGALVLITGLCFILARRRLVALG
jgi:ABC-2 type transport system permease protein